jgi:hypothetical protein
VGDTTRADKPGKKGKIMRGLAYGGKAETTKVARTITPSEESGRWHTCVLGQGNFFYLLTEDI